MRRKRRSWKTKFDPVADWDGLVTAPNHMRIEPELMHWNSKMNFQMLSQLLWVEKEDADAKATPIGGMQYRFKGTK